MPRENDNKKRWLQLNDWDSFYKSDDPFDITNNSEEIKKNELIINLLKKKKSKHIIDLGCGEGVWTSTYKIKSEIIFACDISSKAIKRAKDNYSNVANFFTWNIIDKFQDKYFRKFDAVICNEVLYYIDPNYYDKVKNNIYSLAKKEGYLILSLGHYFNIKDVKRIFSELKIDYHKEIKRSNGTYFMIVGGKINV